MFQKCLLILVKCIVIQVSVLFSTVHMHVHVSVHVIFKRED